MNTSTSFVSYSCACSQTRSHSSVRVKTRPGSRIRTFNNISSRGESSMRCAVESEIADAQGQNGFLGITPPQRADAGHQFLHGKWLGQIIVSSKLQPSYSIIDSAACG